MSQQITDLAAAILAGGRGTRLRPVIGERQKVVAPVAGRPFLHHLLDPLADVGLKHAVLCVGYHADELHDIIGDRYRSIRIAYSTETASLGTAGALRQALPLLESDPVLALNGDSFCAVDFAALRAAHRQRAATIVVREVADITASGRVTFDATGAVTGFVEKGAIAGSSWINAGIYLLSRRFLKSIPDGRPASIEREIFPSWVGRGLYVFPTTGMFLDIGTPPAYAAAQKLF